MIDGEILSSLEFKQINVMHDLKLSSIRSRINVKLFDQVTYLFD